MIVKKRQVVADFLKEFTNSLQEEQKPCEKNVWVINVDDLATKRSSGAGIVLTTPDGMQLGHAIRMEFKTNNNKADYDAVLAGLTVAKELGVEWMFSTREAKPCHSSSVSPRKKLNTC